MSQSRFHYHYQSFSYYYSYINNVNAILKIDCVFLFFLTLSWSATKNFFKNTIATKAYE